MGTQSPTSSPLCSCPEPSCCPPLRPSGLLCLTADPEQGGCHSVTETFKTEPKSALPLGCWSRILVTESWLAQRASSFSCGHLFRSCSRLRKCSLACAWWLASAVREDLTLPSARSLFLQFPLCHLVPVHRGPSVGTLQRCAQGDDQVSSCLLMTWGAFSFPSHLWPVQAVN